MTPEKYVLDTSALTAFMEAEQGAELVEKLLDEHPESVIIPWAALFEIYYTSKRKRGEEEAERRYIFVKELPVEIIWQLTERSVLTAAKLKASYRLSVADAFIASIAIQENAILIHKDPEFEPLSGKIQMEILPYKK